MKGLGFGRVRLVGLLDLIVYDYDAVGVGKLGGEGRRLNWGWDRVSGCGVDHGSRSKLIMSARYIQPQAEGCEETYEDDKF